MFEIGISQSTKCDDLVGFPKSGHMYSYIAIIGHISYICFTVPKIVIQESTPDL